MRFMLDTTMFALPLLASVLVGPVGVAMVMLVYCTVHFRAPWMIRIPKRLDKLDNCMNLVMWGEIRTEAVAPTTKQDHLGEGDVLGQDHVLLQSVNSE
jgi:hypothetical protein